MPWSSDTSTIAASARAGGESIAPSSRICRPPGQDRTCSAPRAGPGPRSSPVTRAAEFENLEDAIFLDDGGLAGAPAFTPVYRSSRPWTERSRRAHLIEYDPGPRPGFEGALIVAEPEPAPTSGGLRSRPHQTAPLRALSRDPTLGILADLDRMTRRSSSGHWVAGWLSRDAFDSYLARATPPLWQLYVPTMLITSVTAWRHRRIRDLYRDGAGAEYDLAKSWLLKRSGDLAPGEVGGQGAAASPLPTSAAPRVLRKSGFAPTPRAAGRRRDHDRRPTTTPPSPAARQKGLLGGGDDLVMESVGDQHRTGAMRHPGLELMAGSSALRLTRSRSLLGVRRKVDGLSPGTDGRPAGSAAHRAVDAGIGLASPRQRPG
jgi:hypothetical protein